MAQLRESMGSVNLQLPDDPVLLEAAGRVALAHGQLELMLRMTIRTLSGLTVKEALDATEKWKSWQLRKEIDALFRNKTTDRSLRLKLNAMLGKCERLSDERNRLLHNALGMIEETVVVAKSADHTWGAPPKAEDLEMVTQEIRELVRDFNNARLTGFIRGVCDAAATDDSGS